MTFTGIRCKILSLALVFFLVPVLIGITIPSTDQGVLFGSKAEAATAQALSSLKIGDRVVDPSWEWEFRLLPNYVRSTDDIDGPIIWIVVAKDHYGANSGVTLLSEGVIGQWVFDNSTNRGSNHGSHHWGNSGNPNAVKGLRPWLNSKDIHTGEGFFQAMGTDFRRSVLNNVIPNRVRGGGAYTTRDRVFIPSNTELGFPLPGDSSYGTYFHAIGTVWPYFRGAGDAKRQAILPGYTDGYPYRFYWTRSPYRTNAHSAGMVSDRGSWTGRYSREDGYIRPAVSLKGDVPVSLVKNANGVYEIDWDGQVPQGPPGSPMLRAPNNRAVVLGSRIIFRWWPVENATRYQIQIRRVSNNSIFRNATVRGGDSFRRPLPNFPNDGTRFRWRMRAYNEAGWGPWSSYRVFTNGR